MSVDDIKEIYAVREAVESAAARILLAAPQDQINVTGKALKEILTEMAKQVELSDWHAISRLDMQFHTSFVEGAKNSRLLRIYDTLAAESRMCIVNLEVSYPRVDALVQEHQNILDLLEAGDSDGLERAISGHMQKAVEDLTAIQQN